MNIFNKDLIIIIKLVQDKIYISQYKILINMRIIINIVIINMRIINMIIINIETKKRNHLVILINNNNLKIKNHLI